ncbi:MAG: MoaD/ThiS family protein [Magnetovibrio sp.]|nr:MoaD/ThiS family protein [Magnetovibrio sp.]
MLITIKLFASLDKYLPDGAVKNQVPMTVEEGVTVLDVIKSLKLPQEHCHLVLIDGVYVAPTERETRIMAEGEALAIWPPVAGG